MPLEHENTQEIAARLNELQDQFELIFGTIYPGNYLTPWNLLFNQIQQGVFTSEGDNANFWLKEIAQKLDTQTQALTNVFSMLETIDTRMEIVASFSDYIHGYLTTDQAVVLGQIRDALDLLNTNGSLNAQNTQTIIAAQPACCDDISYTTNIPEDLCQRQQALTVKICDIMNVMSTWSSFGRLPTKDEVKRLFTFYAWTPGGPTFITDAEISEIVNAFRGISEAQFSQLYGLCDNIEFFFYVMERFNNSGGSIQTANAFINASWDIAGLDNNVKRLISKLFAPSLINFVFQEESYMEQSGYSPDGCGETPSGDWECCDTVAMIMPDSSTPVRNETPASTTCEIPTFAVVQLTVLEDDTGGNPSAQLYLDTTSPDTLVTTLVYGVPYELEINDFPPLDRYYIRFTNALPGTNTTEYNRVQVCVKAQEV